MVIQWIPRANGMQIQYDYVILYTKTMLGNFLRFLSVGRICVSGVLSNILGDHAHYPSPLAISTLYSPGPTFNILNQSA